METKTYQTPEMLQQEIAANSIICASNDQGGAGTFEEVAW